MAADSTTVAMRDGTELSTDIYRPGTGGPWPTLLLRTPYGGGGETGIAQLFVNRGFAVVVQQARGTGESGGEFQPMAQERTDALDTVDWLIDRSWVDDGAGLGVFGMSYLLPASLAAMAHRDAVRTAVNVAGFTDLYRVTHPDGVGKIHHMLPWTINRRYPDADLSSVDWEAAFRTVPIEEAAATAGYDNDLWREWCSLPTAPDDERRGVWSLDDLLTAVDVPTLHVAGWYDLTLGSTLRTYEHLAVTASTPQHLVVGPWTHGGIFDESTTLRGVEFGSASRPDLWDHIAAWFRRWLRGEDDALAATGLTTDSAPVSAFTTGANRWIDTDRWPPDHAAPTTLFLAEHGRLVECQTETKSPTNGTTTETTSGEPATNETPPTGTVATLPVDPEVPVPTDGGTVFQTADLSGGPADRQPYHDRCDVLTFLSDPLDDPLTVAGPVECELAISPGTVPAAVAVKLLDIDPRGAARVVADGIGQVQGRDETTTSVDCWHAAHQFQVGHRIGLELAGSDFPRFQRIPANAEPFEHRIRLDEATGSRLMLSTLRGD